MSFLRDLWEAMKAEEHPDYTSDREWHCDSLLIVRDVEYAAKFWGNAVVNVHPISEDHADLICSASVDGWTPTMKNAHVKSRVVVVGGYGAATTREAGVICKGMDDNGWAYTWYVNEAAEHADRGIKRCSWTGDGPAPRLDSLLDAGISSAPVSRPDPYGDDE